MLQIFPFASGSNMAQHGTGDKKVPEDKWQEERALNWEFKLVLIISANKQPFNFRKKIYQYTMSLFTHLQGEQHFSNSSEKHSFNETLIGVQKKRKMGNIFISNIFWKSYIKFGQISLI